MDKDKRVEIDDALTKIRNAGTIIFEARNIALSDDINGVLSRVKKDDEYNPKMLSAYDWVTQYYDFIQAIMYEVVNVIEQETDKIQDIIYK